MANTRLAVLGSPIAHSRSPLLHHTAYSVLGLDWSYEAVELGVGDLAPFIAACDSEWRGFSLTMPLKNEAARIAGSLDEVAQLTGAVNTLALGGSHEPTRGYNTDVHGLAHAVSAATSDSIGDVIIVGAGATAMSALVASARLGARRVTIAARQPERAAALLEVGSALGLATTAIPLGRPQPDFTADLVVSTLPGGAEVAARDIAGTGWAEHVASSLLLDVSYDPWPSPLAQEWLSHGGVALSGLAMLVHQALVQVRIFLEGDPARPLENERAVLKAMLDAVNLSENGFMV